MNRVDGVILGVGVVVLVASIVGVILYDDTDGTEFEVSFEPSDAQMLPEDSEEGVSAGEYTFGWQVNATGLATMAFEVDATANGVRATDDQVQVDAQGPDGLTASCTFTMDAGPSGSGTCQAETDVQDPPSAAMIRAEDSQAAEEQGATMLSSTGMGTWNVTVTITGGTAGPAGASPSYTVTVTPSYTVFEPVARPPASGSPGGPG